MLFYDMKMIDNVLCISILYILLKLKYTMRLFGNLNSSLNKICLDIWITVFIICIFIFHLV